MFIREKNSRENKFFLQPMEKMDEIVNIAVTDKSAIGKKHIPLKNRNN